MVNNLDNIDFWVEETMLFDLKVAVAMYLHSLNVGTLTDWLTSNQDDLYLYGKAIHKFFRSIEDCIKNEDDILRYIHDVRILRKIVKFL